MYEEIDMDNLTTIMAPVVAVPAQSHPSSLCNGTSGSLNSNLTTLMDISAPSMNLHSSTNYS
jgi:hypothetical protein